MIAIIDYGMGNLRSVEKALQKSGGEVRLVKHPSDIAKADQIVLPGVGAFGDCMANLEKQGLADAIRKFVQTQKPFLGICLGYQALFEGSEENPGVRGLGILKGQVIRFPEGALKVPQIGWNQMTIRKKECPLLKGVEDQSHVYFVHSYYPVPMDADVICVETDYGKTFASMVWRDQIYACQFHPEKSQTVGLKMLENFVQLG